MGVAEWKDLWFSSVNYNLVRVLNRLAEIVEEDGGTVIYHDKEKLIHTRGFVEPIEKLRELKEATRKMLEMTLEDGPYISRMEAMNRIDKELSALLEEEKRAPVIRSKLVSTYGIGMWIDFEVGGFQYHFGPDDNPFFPDSVLKIPVGAKEEYYRDEIESGDKPWLIDNLFEPVAMDESIEKAARILYRRMLALPISERYE